MRRARTGSRREPTIALINIVFLMLVFFMVAGTLAQPMDKDLNLVRTADLEGRPPPDALVIRADGTLSYLGVELTSSAAYMLPRNDVANPEVRLVPDRDLPADQLVRIARELRALGAGRVMIVTERGLE
ncbi:ExbD/TolR family protein [Roseovarius sp. Pro17]|uniref:ExbD/TolR family protein n=1 Tax=Roseovarius sp. Pro17 TaxID=3108175 RepID=UPI002D77D85B|nr:biopolymer transporter ExbD [Roseovarius sp. Pro17]